MFSKVAVPIYIPTNSAQLFPFLTSSSILVISCPFDNSHSNKCDVISHSGFDLHFPMISDVEHLFMYLFVICMASLEKNVYSGPLPIIKFYYFLLFAIKVFIYSGY